MAQSPCGAGPAKGCWEHLVLRLGAGARLQQRLYHLRPARLGRLTRAPLGVSGGAPTQAARLRAP
jgi:hypothetical protein